MEEPIVATRRRLNASVSAWLDYRGHNATDIHKATGISRDVVYRLTNMPGANAPDNDRKWLPALASLVRLGAYLDVEPSQLLAGALPPDGTAPDTKPPAIAPDRLQELEDEVDALGSTLGDLQDTVGRTQLLVARGVELLARELGLPDETIRRMQRELQ